MPVISRSDLNNPDLYVQTWFRAPVYPPVICYIAIENKPFVVDLPSQTRDFPKSYVNAYQRRIFFFFSVPRTDASFYHGKIHGLFLEGTMISRSMPRGMVS